MTLKPFLLALSLVSCAHSAPAPDQKAPVLQTSEIPRVPLEADRVFNHTDEFLLHAGVPSAFIKRIREQYLKKGAHRLERTEKILEPNLFGFLYHGNYLSHDSETARKKIKRYIRAHHNSFKKAEERFHVSAESIASLLWVETKLGKTTGTNPLPLVFYSIATSLDPEMCQEMASRLPEKLNQTTLPEKPSLDVARAKLKDRCSSKAKWASEELKTLAQLEQKGTLKAFTLKGSFAGAFGIPQFIPSSLVKYGISSFRKRVDLFLISDAILSVGNFLHQNGWKEDSDTAQTEALYSYNRSRDYGTVIRKIQSEIRAD